MKLVYARYGLQIDMKENRVDTLVIENPFAMVELVSQLWEQSNGGEGDFILSFDKTLKIEKNMEVILNPFSLDFNNRKITSALYGVLEETANSYVLEKAEINSSCIQVLEQILLSQSYMGIEYELDFAWNELFKLYGVKITKDYSSLLEKLIEYIKIMATLCGVRVICLVNIKCYLNSEELLELIRNVHYNKIQLVLVESQEAEKIADENIYIIDKDNCLITR